MYKKSINSLLECDEGNAYYSAYLIAIAATKAG